ncbi:MAG: hypothetical protein JNK92_11845 [Dechloromonas sp.]|nr:hypothetical protein [Dechloromonas sp.]
MFKKRDVAASPAPISQRRPLQFDQLLAGMGALSVLQEHDVAAKLWLPEPAALALEDFSKVQGISRSEMLRHFFAAHSYGVYVVELLRGQFPEVFRDQEPVRFSRASHEPPPGKKRHVTYWVPELGKNVAPIKLWIATRLRNDLQALADHVHLPLSQYLREIVVSRLLGHGMLPMRPEMLEAAPLPSADDWCEDREIPWREVDAETYQSSREGRIESAWVDE